MKRTYQSVMIKKKDMTEEENRCILAETETYKGRSNHYVISTKKLL